MTWIELKLEPGWYISDDFLRLKNRFNDIEHLVYRNNDIYTDNGDEIRDTFKKEIKQLRLENRLSCLDIMLREMGYAV